MFLGEYNHSIDPKNRVIVPVKFREQLGDKFIVSIGLDGCLFLMTTEAWDEKLSALMKLNTSFEQRQLVRYFSHNSSECETDKAGRILIPLNLVKMAGLKKDVVLSGAGDKVEIWSKEKYDENTIAESPESIVERLAAENGLVF